MEKNCNNCGRALGERTVCDDCTTTYNVNTDGFGTPTHWIPMGEVKEAVHHPDHYQSSTGLEVIDVIEAFTSDLSGVEAFDAGNVFKYLCRWKSKNGLEDLKKAKWYLEHLIKCIEKE